MNKNILYLTIILSIICHSVQANGRDSLDTQPTQPKNVIYLRLSFLVIQGAASINYERLLATTNKIFHESHYLRFSLGYSGAWGGYEGKAAEISLQEVFGAKKSHLEVGLGLWGIYDNFDEKVFLRPLASVGYRYQKPSGGFVFRSGIRFPELVYMSFGLAF